MTEYALEFHGYSYGYPGAGENALKNINLKIKKGAFVGLTGPTGAGKTTFIKSVNGIIPHFEGGTIRGDVQLQGLDTRTLNTAQIARMVGTVFDDPEAQIVCLDVEQELAFGLENLGVAPEEMEQRIHTALSQTGIAHLRTRSTVPYPADRSSVWPLPRPWLCVPKCWCWMNLLRNWTPWAVRKYFRC